MGLSLLLVTKKDSLLQIRLVFATDKRFEIIDLPAVQQKVNARCKALIQMTDSIIVPVYFFYHDQLQLPKSISEKSKQEIEKLQKRGFRISAYPVTVVEFEAVR